MLTAASFTLLSAEYFISFRSQIARAGLQFVSLSIELHFEMLLHSQGSFMRAGAPLSPSLLQPRWLPQCWHLVSLDELNGTEAAG